MNRHVALMLPLIVLVCLLSACSSALGPFNALTSGSAYERHADVAYGDNPRQRMDVYRARNPLPDASTVVFVFGSAWRAGLRQDYAFMAQSLASQGHDVLIPDYRLYPEVTWPDFIVDVASAIRRLEQDADQWLGRPLQRIVLMGHSSGAHTAAVIAGDPARWLTDVNASLVGLIGISGPYDLPLGDPEVTPVFAGAEEPSSAIPVDTVSADHPPSLLLHGTSDRRVLPRHTQSMAEALEALSIPVEVHMLEGVGHGRAIVNFAAPLHFFSDEPEIVAGWLKVLDE